MAASNHSSGDHMSDGSTLTTYDSDEVGAYAGQIANMLAFPMVMQAAIELDLLEIVAGAEISGRPISAAEIADQLPTSNKENAAHKVDRMLRLLAAFEVVTCSVDARGCRVYGLAPVAWYFVGDEKNVSFGPYVVMAQDDDVINSWRKLKDAILEGGIPFNKAHHGMHIFEYTCLNPKFNDLFNLALSNYTTVVTKKVLLHYKGFENLTQLVDVGGGLGHTLELILSKYPTLKGINFDLPHVIDRAPTIPGVEHVRGDMFVSVPYPAEAILMKLILHDWDDEHCMKVLTNCYNALPDNGKVIVVEHVLADEIDTTTASKDILLMDVLMMTHCLDGRERTKKEFTTLANVAGFNTIKFVFYVCNFCVMEFCK